MGVCLQVAEEVGLELDGALYKHLAALWVLALDEQIDQPRYPSQLRSGKADHHIALL